MSLFNFDHRTFRLVLAGAVLALGGGALGTGCGGGNLGTIDGFCTQLAAADCSYSIVQACFGSNDATIQADTDSCISVRSRIDKCNPNNLTYHPEFADACIAQHQQVFNSSAIDSVSYASLTEACLAAFNKGRPEGAECAQDSDCDVGYAGLRCLVRVGGKGTCQVPQPVGGGASCKDASAQCPDGTYCDAGFHCVEVGHEGDICGAGQPCGVGKRCVDGICSKQLPNGSKCSEQDDCAGGFCLGASNGQGLCSASFVFAFGSSTCLDFTQF